MKTEIEHVCEEDTSLRLWSEAPQDVKSEVKRDDGGSQVERSASESSISIDGEDQGNSEGSIEEEEVDSSRSKRNSDEKTELDILCQNARVCDELGGKCTFSCDQCTYVCRTWSSMAKHLKRNHGALATNVSQYIKEAFSHECKICSTKLLCDSDFVKKHLMVKHKMTMTEYRKKFSLQTVNFILPENTPLSDAIGNLCTFTCKVCKALYHCTKMFAKHLKVNHCIPPHKSMHEHLSRSVAHKCRICSEKILCDGNYLVSHFSTHNVKSLTEYCKITGCLRQRRNGIKAKSLRDSDISNEIGNFCEYSCFKCGLKSSSWPTMLQHFKKAKHGSKKNVSSEHVTKYVSYRCKHCSKRLLCNKNAIQQHMMKRHKKVFSSDMRAKYEELQKEFMKAEPIYPAQTGIVLPPDSIPRESVTNCFGNLCKFKCLVCPNKMFRCFHSLMCHHKEDHGRWAQYDPKSVLTARYHQCLICQKIILCDLRFLTTHLISNHRTKPAEYRQKVTQNGGKVWLSYRDTYDKMINEEIRSLE